MTDVNPSTPTEILADAITTVLLQVGGYKDGAEANFDAQATLEGIAENDSECIALFQRLILQAEGASNFIETFSADAGPDTARFSNEDDQPKADVSAGTTFDTAIAPINLSTVPAGEFDEALDSMAGLLTSIGLSLGINPDQVAADVAKVRAEALAELNADQADTQPLRTGEVFYLDPKSLKLVSHNDDEYRANPFGGFTRVG